MSEQVASNFDTWAASASASEIESRIQELDEDMRRVSLAGIERVAFQMNILEDILKTKKQEE
ncbi:hypothetical protein HY312_02615 [Candidatus Saccharibacteria bacterium]|nr:hypothetical protein [Candidatus Saccharibacteria bacterium]